MERVVLNEVAMESPPPSGRWLRGGARARRPQEVGLRAFFSTPCAFANQNAPIKVLPFRESYALTTSISDRFPRVVCERVCCSFGGSGAGIPYRRCTNRLHFGRTRTQEETAGW